jgi:hypothetical protein
VFRDECPGCTIKRLDLYWRSASLSFCHHVLSMRGRLRCSASWFKGLAPVVTFASF